MGDSARAVAAMSTALLAQRLPPLPKFDGTPGPGTDRESVYKYSLLLNHFPVDSWMDVFSCQPGFHLGFFVLEGRNS